MTLARRSFIGAIFAAAAAPAFVRTLSSPIWVPQASRMGEWGDRSSVVTTELFGPSRETLHREVMSYSARDKLQLFLPFNITSAASIYGLRVCGGFHQRELVFDSGLKHVCAGDSLLTTVKLVSPIGGRR